MNERNEADFPHPCCESRELRKIIAQLQEKNANLSKLAKLYEIDMSPFNNTPILRTDQKKLDITDPTQQQVEVFIDGDWHPCILVTANYDHANKLPVIVKNLAGRTIYHIATSWDLRIQQSKTHT